MSFTAKINTGIIANDGKGAGLRTNMRILIANDVYLRELLAKNTSKLLNFNSQLTGLNTSFGDHNHDDRYYRNYEVDKFLNTKLGVNETAKNALNAYKLGNHPPEYYANSATTYTKTDVDNAILTSMNEVVQILLNNPDVEINSIQELLSEMTTADNALVASIANKVSYVVFQNLSEEQKNIAQSNIGLLNHTHTGKYIEQQYLVDRETSEASFPKNEFSKGITLETTAQGVSNGFPEFNGSLVHFFFGQTGQVASSQQRAFTFWKGFSGDIYYRCYNSDGTPKNFEKIFTKESLKKTDVDALEINAKTLEGKNASDFSSNNHTHSQYLLLTGGRLSDDLEIIKSKAGDVGGLLRLINPVDSSTTNHSNAIEFLLGGSINDGVRILSEAQNSYGNNVDLKFQVQKNGSGWITNVTVRHDGKLFVGSNEVYHNGNLPKQTVKPLSSVTTYTAKVSDVGNIVPLSNANTQIILNTASFPRIGDKAQYFYKGTGTCKVATSGSANELKNINDTLEFDGQNSMIEITKTGANEYFVCGQLIRA
ncbi:hypothetical protein [Tenacibaculum dicentrarchi]|uniref:hypothetical protein n=1 Tax=Tenacibaculum dicentrarchi TaxID=669041 RepID=UPI0035134A34